jgi:hypothetical protein
MFFQQFLQCEDEEENLRMLATIKWKKPFFFIFYLPQLLAANKTYRVWKTIYSSDQQPDFRLMILFFLIQHIHQSYSTVCLLLETQKAGATSLYEARVFYLRQTIRFYVRDDEQMEKLIDLTSRLH